MLFVCYSFDVHMTHDINKDAELLDVKVKFRLDADKDTQKAIMANYNDPDLVDDPKFVDGYWDMAFCTTAQPQDITVEFVGYANSHLVNVLWDYQGCEVVGDNGVAEPLWGAV